MEIPKIDETKLSEVKEIIEKAATIMEEKDYNKDKKAKQELFELEMKLRIIIGKKKFDIKQVYGYWSYTDIETIATKILMKEPQKYGLSDEALEKLIISIFNSGDLEKESGFDYWYEFLEQETGMEGVMDELFCIDERGKIVYAQIDIVMEKIRQKR